MVSIFVASKQADMIYSGKKKSIVMKRHLKQYLSNDLTLVTKKKGVGFALGKIKLFKPNIINSSMFLKLESQHLLTQKEKKEKFPGAKKFYSYEIHKFEKFEKPQMIQLKSNVQSLQNFSSNGDFSKEIETYNPMTLTRKVLQDDFKIVSNWYFSQKQGRKIKATNEQVLGTASKIYFELRRKGTLIKDGELVSKIKENCLVNLPNYEGGKIVDFLNSANLSRKEDEIILFRPFFQESEL